jgi:hypothetical protein
MTRTTLEFYECEHVEDLDNYISDITDCGGEIIVSGVNHEDEIGTVAFKVKDEREFYIEFAKTDAYQFIN